MIQKTLRTVVLSTALIFAAFSIIPSHAEARFEPWNIIDPFCLFSCGDEPVQNTTYTNSNNINSYNTNSTIGTTVVGSGSVYTSPSYTTPVYTTPNTVVQPAPIIINNPAPTVITTPTPVYAYNQPSYNYNYTPTPVYVPTPVYNYYPNPTYVYSYPLTVTCSANTTFAPVGTTVTWSAYATGGSGSYTYSWSGTDSLYGTGSFVSTYYNSPGVKTNYVTVYSNGQQTSAQCSNTVTVGAPIVTYTQYQNVQYSSPVLQVACGADRTTANIGSLVTWSSEAYGGTGKYIYSWTGTNSLLSDKPSAITSYATPGVKSAIVTVTASNGQSVSKVCENTVTVRANAVARTPAVRAATVAPVAIVQPVAVAPVVPAPATNMTAASLFSLQNVPWGLVGILIILILLGMVIYLFVNRNKI